MTCLESTVTFRLAMRNIALLLWIWSAVICLKKQVIEEPKRLPYVGLKTKLIIGS